VLAQPGLHAGGRVEAEGRTAREHDRVNALDGQRRIEQRHLTRARPPAAHVGRGDGRRVEHDRGHARRKTRIAGISDADAGDIGDEIARLCWRHGRLRAGDDLLSHL